LTSAINPNLYPFIGSNPTAMMNPYGPNGVEHIVWAGWAGTGERARQKFNEAHKAWRQEFPGRSRPGGDARPQLEAAPTRPTNDCKPTHSEQKTEYSFTVKPVAVKKDGTLIEVWEDMVGAVTKDDAIRTCQQAGKKCRDGYIWMCTGEQGAMPMQGEWLYYSKAIGQ